MFDRPCPVDQFGLIEGRKTAPCGNILGSKRRRVNASSGFALDLHSRPFFEQSQGGGVVEVAVAFFSSQVVDLLDGFEGGQLYASFFGGLEREQDVFVHEAQREVGTEVALQNEGRFIFDDAGAHHGGLDQRHELFWVHTEFGGESEPFGEAFENQRDLQIHGELGGLAL